MARAIVDGVSARTRSLLAVGGWLLAACLATLVGVVAVRAIGSGIVGGTARPLDHDQVGRALAGSTPQPSGGTSVTPPPGSTTRTLSTAGGTVTARCAGGKATILAWSPAQGYRADDVDRDPDDSVRLTFESDPRDITVTITCAAGVPAAHTATETDD